MDFGEVRLYFSLNLSLHSIKYAMSRPTSSHILSHQSQQKQHLSPDRRKPARRKENTPARGRHALADSTGLPHPVKAVAGELAALIGIENLRLAMADHLTSAVERMLSGTTHRCAASVPGSPRYRPWAVVALQAHRAKPTDLDPKAKAAQ